MSTESRSPEARHRVTDIALPVLIARAGGSVAITREERDQIVRQHGRGGEFVIEHNVGPEEPRPSG